MPSVKYCWPDAEGDHELEFVRVPGTHGDPYSFGEAPSCVLIEVPDFFMAAVPVTQRLWSHVMGEDAWLLNVETVECHGIVREVAVVLAHVAKQIAHSGVVEFTALQSSLVETCKRIVRKIDRPLPVVDVSGDPIRENT